MLGLFLIVELLSAQTKLPCQPVGGPNSIQTKVNPASNMQLYSTQLQNCIFLTVLKHFIFKILYFEGDIISNNSPNGPFLICRAEIRHFKLIMDSQGE